MNRLNRYALSLLGLSVLLAIIAGLNATPTQAGPVVSGTVNIGNTPLPVTIAGDTNINGTVKVQDVDNPARHPFQRRVFVTSDSDQFTVPSGKRLVIEYVWFGDIQPTNGPKVVKFTISSISNLSGYWDFTPQSTLPSQFDTVEWMADRQVKMYFEPDSQVDVHDLRNTTSNTGFTYTVSGYLVDLP
jgi:hypothetical protein